MVLMSTMMRIDSVFDSCTLSLLGSSVVSLDLNLIISFQRSQILVFLTTFSRMSNAQNRLQWCETLLHCVDDDDDDDDDWDDGDDVYWDDDVDDDDDGEEEDEDDDNDNDNFISFILKTI